MTPAHVRNFDPFAPAPGAAEMLALEPRILLDAAFADGIENAYDAQALDGPAPLIDLDGDASPSVDVAVAYPDGAISASIVPDGLILDDQDDIVLLEITFGGDRAGIDDAVRVGDQLINLGVDGTFEDVALGAGRLDITYVATTGVMTFTREGDAIPVADLQAFLDGFRYGNLAIAPRQADLTFTFRAVDAGGNEASATSTLTIDSSGATPVALLDPNGDNSVIGTFFPLFVENGAPVPIADEDIVVLDRDGSNIDEIVIRLANPQAGDALEVNLPDEIEGLGTFEESLPDGSFQITIISSSEASIGTSADNYADVALALQSVTFTSTSEAPSTVPRLISIVMTDDTGTKGQPARLRVEVVSVNDRPALDLDRSNDTDNGPDYRTGFVENALGVAIIDIGDNIVADIDHSVMQSAGIAITNPEFGDRLFVDPAATLPGGLTVSVGGNGTSLSIVGTGSSEDYSRALEAIRFESQGEAPVPGDRRIEVRVNDGQNDSNTGTAFVQVSALNDPPIVIDPTDPSGTPLDPNAVVPLQNGIDAEVLTVLQMGQYFDDLDGDALTYTFPQGAPAWLSIDNGSGAVTGTPPSDASQISNVGEPGLYAVVVRASDPAGASAETTVLIRIANPVPEARPDSATANDGGPPITGSVFLDNGAGPDTDPDGDQLIVTSVNGRMVDVGVAVGGSTGGSFVIRADGTYSFDPDTAFLQLREGQQIATSVQYQVSDGQGGFETTTLTVVVTGTNQAPVARDDVIGAGENRAATGNLLADNGFGVDSDPDGDDITVVAVEGSVFTANVPVTLASGAQVTLRGDGTYIYDPNRAFEALAPGEMGTDTFTYTIADPSGETSVATVTVNVEGANDAPIPVDPTRPPTDPNDPNGPPVDPDDPRLPPLDPQDYIPEQVHLDGETITSLPLAPFFGDPDATDTLTIEIDPRGLPESLVFNAAMGTISGTLSPDASQLGNGGVYRVPVTATDPQGASFTTFLTFRITNPGPQAVDDVLGTPADTVSADNVLTNDSDPDGDALRVVAVEGSAGLVGNVLAGSAGGVFRITEDGTVSFDPNGDFDALLLGETRTTSIGYTITDDQGGTSSATVTVTVSDANEVPGLLTPPAPQNGMDAVPLTALDIGALVNDPDGDALAFTLTGAPDWMAIDPDTGRITGTPPNDASAGGPTADGRYPVTVNVSDGRLAIDVPVVWTIANPAPAAVDDALPLPEGGSGTVSLLGNDMDPDADALTVVTLGGQPIGSGPFVTPGGLTLSIGSGGISVDASTLPRELARGETFAESIAYTIRDAQGAMSSANLVVTVTGTNDAPEIVAEADLRLGTDAVPIVPVDAAALVMDVDGDALTFTLAPDSPAWLAVDPATGLVTGTPPNDASAGGPAGDGRYSVTVVASDGLASVDVPLTLAISNPGPTAVADTLTLTEGETGTVSLVANDTDPDGDALTLVSVGGQPVGGVPFATSGGLTLTIGPNGVSVDASTLPQELARGEVFTETVTYTIRDAQGATSSANLVVTVMGANDAPEIVGDAGLREGVDAMPIAPIDVAALVTDVDGDALTFALAPDSPAWLTVDPSTGIVTGTPPNDASAGGPAGDGRYAVAVVVSDGLASVEVPLTLAISNPAPSAADDAGRTVADATIEMDLLANDADPDGDDHWIASVEGQAIAVGETVRLASGATVTMTGPSTLMFDPAGAHDAVFEGAFAMDGFAYSITDAQGAAAEARATVRVDGVLPPFFDDDRPIEPPVDPRLPADPVPPDTFVGPPILTQALEEIDPLSPVVAIDVTSPVPILTQANEQIERLGGDVSLFGAPILTEALDRVGDRDDSEARWRALTGWGDTFPADEPFRGNEFTALLPDGGSTLIRSLVRDDVVYLDLGTFGRTRFTGFMVEGSGHARVAHLDRNIVQIERPANATHEHVDVILTARDGAVYGVPLRVDLVSGEIRLEGGIVKDFAISVTGLDLTATEVIDPHRAAVDALFDGEGKANN